MAKTLEDAIRYATERGELVHLSVVASGKTFRATFAPASAGQGYTTAEDKDPIVAMVDAIMGTPMSRKSTKVVEIEEDEALL